MRQKTASIPPPMHPRGFPAKIADNNMIPILNNTVPTDRARIEALLNNLFLNPVTTAVNLGERAAQNDSVQQILAAVARDGDETVVATAKFFDDPNFTIEQIRVSASEISEAAAAIPADQLSAIRRSIEQVREYQTHFMPANPKPLRRPGVELGMPLHPPRLRRPLYPRRKSRLPSSLIMLAVPAQVAGVKESSSARRPANMAAPISSSPPATNSN